MELVDVKMLADILVADLCHVGLLVKNTRWNHCDVTPNSNELNFFGNKFYPHLTERCVNAGVLFTDHDGRFVAFWFQGCEFICCDLYWDHKSPVDQPDYIIFRQTRGGHIFYSAVEIHENVLMGAIMNPIGVILGRLVLDYGPKIEC